MSVALATRGYIVPPSTGSTTILVDHILRPIAGQEDPNPVTLIASQTQVLGDSQQSSTVRTSDDSAKVVADDDDGPIIKPGCS